MNSGLGLEPEILSQAADAGKEIVINITPRASEIAPMSTCAVATSAALFDQITPAPKRACITIIPSQSRARRLKGCFLPKERRATQAQTPVPHRIIIAKIR